MFPGAGGWGWTSSTCTCTSSSISAIAAAAGGWSWSGSWSWSFPCCPPNVGPGLDCCKVKENGYSSSFWGISWCNLVQALYCARGTQNKLNIKVTHSSRCGSLGGVLGLLGAPRGLPLPLHWFLLNWGCLHRSEPKNKELHE